MLDNVLELLTRSGRDLLHSLITLVPSAWEGVLDLPDAVRAFFEYHGCLGEPWDGPAGLAFSDGRFAAAALARNGRRPARYIVTRDDLVVVASEAGVVDVPPEQIVEKGRLGPGQILAVDTYKAIVLHDDEIKGTCAMRKPYGAWIERHMIRLTGVHGPAEVGGPAGLRRALVALIEDACAAAERGPRILILTDQGVTADRAPIPMLLAVSAGPHALIRRGRRAPAGW